MKKSIQLFHWLPRILCIIAILFVSMFAADSFDPELTLGEQLLGFFMHLIPSLILILCLIVAWKWELVGGIAFVTIGVLLSPIIFMGNYRNNHNFWISFVVILTITIPFALVGILFILSYMKKKHAARLSKSMKDEPPLL